MVTGALFDVVDELLDWLHLQEAEALRDGVEEEEPVRPADTGLDGGRLRTFLEKGTEKQWGRSPGSMAAIPNGRLRQGKAALFTHKK